MFTNSNTHFIALRAGLIKSADLKSSLLGKVPSLFEKFIGEEALKSNLGQRLFQGLQDQKYTAGLAQELLGSHYYAGRDLPAFISEGLGKQLGIGGAIGGAIGGGAGAGLSDDEHKIRNSVLGALGGAFGGAGITGGRHAFLRTKEFLPTFRKNFSNLSKVLDIGAYPGLMDPINIQPIIEKPFEEAMKNPGLQTFKNLFGAGKDVWKRRNDAYIGFLSPDQNGKLNLPGLLPHLKTFGLKNLNAGDVINPNMVKHLNEELLQKLLRRAGIERVFGSSAYGTVKDVTKEMEKFRDEITNLFHGDLKTKLGEKEYSSLKDLLKSPEFKIKQETHDALKSHYRDWTKTLGGDPVNLLETTDLSKAKVLPSHISQMLDNYFRPEMRNAKTIWENKDLSKGFTFDHLLPEINLPKGKKFYDLPIYSPENLAQKTEEVVRKPQRGQMLAALLKRIEGVRDFPWGEGKLQNPNSYVGGRPFPWGHGELK